MSKKPEEIYEEAKDTIDQVWATLTLKEKIDLLERAGYKLRLYDPEVKDKPSNRTAKEPKANS